jgi:hypothetical protein
VAHAADKSTEAAVPNLRSIAVTILTVALIVVALTWIMPVVGGHNSICDRDPYAAGCR